MGSTSVRNCGDDDDCVGPKTMEPFLQHIWSVHVEEGSHRALLAEAGADPEPRPSAPLPQGCLPACPGTSTEPEGSRRPSLNAVVPEDLCGSSQLHLLIQFFLPKLQHMSGKLSFRAQYPFSQSISRARPRGQGGKGKPKSTRRGESHSSSSPDRKDPQTTNTASTCYITDS